MEKPGIPVLVTLRACCSGGAIRPAVRELHVGCIQSTLTSKKVPWSSDTDVQTTKGSRFTQMCTLLLQHKHCKTYYIMTVDIVLVTSAVQLPHYICTGVVFIHCRLSELYF